MLPGLTSASALASALASVRETGGRGRPLRGRIRGCAGLGRGISGPARADRVECPAPQAGAAATPARPRVQPPPRARPPRRGEQRNALTGRSGASTASTGPAVQVVVHELSVVLEPELLVEPDRAASGVPRSPPGGHSIRLVRTAVELCVLVDGWLVGGPAVAASLSRRPKPVGADSFLHGVGGSGSVSGSVAGSWGRRRVGHPSRVCLPSHTLGIGCPQIRMAGGGCRWGDL